MQDAIRAAIRQFIALVPERPFTCRLTIRDGAVSGHWTTPGPPPLRADTAERPGMRWNTVWDLVDALRQRKDDRGLAATGLDLEFDQDGRVDSTLHFPRVEFDRLDELPREHGMLPRWAYLNLRADLIPQFSDSQLNEMVPVHVEQARAFLGFASDVAYAKSISESFYLVMINCTADSKILNGRFDQFFGRFAEAKPSLIVDFHRSWELFEDAGWTALIDEAVQLYAHFHANVEVARQALGLPAIDKRTESDIMARYHAMQPTLAQLRARTIRGHVEAFTKILVPRR